MMLAGWAGKIAYADLASGCCRIEASPEELLHEWLGGRGLGVALLQREICGSLACNDLPLIFAGGPLCGTTTPATGRCVLTGRSPLTGTVFSSSSGGAFAGQLRQAGLDALVISGVSTTPVMLAITPAGITLQPAEMLWGLTTGAAFEQLAGERAVAVIGPAGENGVLFASVETREGEPFGRGGLGADMGRRRLKAITISGGAAVTRIANKPAFDKAVQDLQRLFLASPFLYGPFGIREHGTAALVDLLARRSMLPGRNFTTLLDGDGLNAAAIRKQFTIAASGCAGCQIACRRQAGDGLPLPDYDTLAALAGCCERSELADVVVASRSCAQLGLDPVSAGGVVAAWAELTGRAIEAGDLPLLFDRIARRAGEGQLLAQGAQRLANQLGMEEAAMTVKGLELPPYDPRSSCGLALAYAVAPHGGTHLDAWPLASEVLRKPVPTDPTSFDGKARSIALSEDVHAAMDSLVLCCFAACAVELEECAALLAAVTGESFGPAELLAAGHRIVAAERAIAKASGLTAGDDRLPERFFRQSVGDAAPLDRQGFDEELARYHRIRGTAK